MSKAEIIAELARLSPEDLADIQSKLDELAGEAWYGRGELSESDKQALDSEIKAYQNDPNAGRPWDEAKTRIQARLRP